MKRNKKKQDLIFSALEGLEIEKPVEPTEPKPLSTENKAVITDPTTVEAEPSHADPEKFAPVILVTDPSDLPNFSFAAVHPGTSVMGSPEHEPGHSKDEVCHEVTITKEFYLQTTPVTQAQWASIMGMNPSHFRNEGNEHPVENVPWNDCQDFIKKLNSMGKPIYRLPTEAEWEYACRAGTTGPCAKGEIPELICEHTAVLDAVGWYCGNSNQMTQPVAQKNPNPWGFYDMHGNVLEWCQDWYAEYGEKKLQRVNGNWVTSTSPRTDPTGPRIGRDRVVRGGSWFSHAKHCRSASRFYWSPDSKRNFIGLRLVREQSEGNSPLIQKVREK